MATATEAPRQPAASAAARVFAADLVLGALGLAGSGFVLLRLLESWRVSPGTAAHHITILGQRLGYPTANADAIVVLALALVALVGLGRAARQAAREVIGAARFRRGLQLVSGEPRDGAVVIDDPRPLAFCAGLLRPQSYISSGTVELLDEHALAAVLEHERHHAQRRDPLRLATTRVLAEALFFVPGLRELARRQATLAELSADEAAIGAAVANRSGLARAMLRFGDTAQDGQALGFDATRVDHVLGDAAPWRFPALLCLFVAVALTVIVAVAVLAGRVAAGSATLAPPFLSSQPCVIVLAAVPVGIALLARRYRSGR